MRFDTPSLLAAALVAVAAIPSALATPFPGSSSSPCCKHNCSPSQIYSAFITPKYLGNTKSFCRQYLRLPVSSVVTKTKTVNVPVYYTKTIVKGKTARPVTITRTKTVSTTVVGQETSLTTNTDISTVSSTSTILVISTSDVTETDYVIATSNVIDTITITTTETATTTNTEILTSTSYIPITSGSKMKRLDAAAADESENAIYIFKRGGVNQYSYAFKIPAYLPQDLKPQQISSACKRINPCPTRTITVTKTKKVPHTRTSTKYTTVTPSVYKTQTVTRTIPKTNTVQQTVVTTIFYTTVTSVTETAQTVTETIATETQTTGTITTTVLTETATETASKTETETATSTVVENRVCTTGITLCSLDRPDSCCSGQCVQFFSSPNCCVSSGQICDILHPEGCCGGTCYRTNVGEPVPIFKCL
ncbi:hypothetical protein TWF788_002585 [Orbilia oligospora]|uniref:Uncharacterized protein n=1 Tax=Orbilia oligospora TaxID=2813651 RepID=A0A7C8TZP0_ORBOL|nr:hypothetical protein TWF788_002585 [Orbilia oligospora]